MNKYIIEHLEPKLWKWCMIEYKHISEIIGKNNLWFTNIKRESKESKELKKYGKVIKQSVSELNLKNACVLDPESSQALSPKEAANFDYFIFGGILGDYPPKKRTAIELTSKIKNAQVRNIGKEQMSTDNAVFVVKEIANGKSLSDLKFQDTIEIKINDVESTSLPYRYTLVNGKPFVSPELITFLKRKKSN